MSDIVDDAAPAIEANQRACLSKITNRAPDTNTSGFCLECDEEISQERILAASKNTKGEPVVDNCIVCQNEIEYRNRQAKRF